MSQLKATHWKDRQGALEQLTRAVKAHPRLAPGVGGLIEALRPRIKDAQVVNALAALHALGAIAQGVGKAVKIHLKAAVPDILLLLGDGKAQIREAAREALDKWVAEISFEPVLPLLPKALAMEAKTAGVVESVETTSTPFWATLITLPAKSVRAAHVKLCSPGRTVSSQTRRTTRLLPRKVALVTAGPPVKLQLLTSSADVESQSSLRRTSMVAPALSKERFWTAAIT